MFVWSITVTHRFIFAVICLALMYSVVAGGESISNDGLLKLIAALNDNDFAAREQAVERLIAAGSISIAPVETALAEANLEVTVRGLQVLAGLAAKADEVHTRDAAFDALSRLSQSSAPALAENAKQVLGTIRSSRQREAVLWFQERGGNIELSLGTAAMGPNWRGADADLSRLVYLYEIHEVAFSGEQVNDTWLQQAARMPDLRQLTLKKVKFSSAGLKPLAEKNQLQALQIMYAALDRESQDLLSAMHRLVELRLYGTGLTAEASQQLLAKLERTRVDIRRGGFLGIGVQPLGEGVIISNVQPGSAAARAGIQLGDILLAFAGEKIANFEQLQAAIGRAPPGEAVELELLRNDKPEKLKLLLGEWE